MPQRLGLSDLRVRFRLPRVCARTGPETRTWSRPGAAGSAYPLAVDDDGNEAGGVMLFTRQRLLG